MTGFLPALPAHALTHVDHDITVDTYWGDDVYHVRESIHIAAGATLQVAAGTVVKFENGEQLVVQGLLFVEGTQWDPVSFTSLADDNIAGDTGGDGPSIGRPGSWAGLRFEPGSDASILNHCEIWFAGGGQQALVNCIGSSPTLSDCRLRAGTIGIRCAEGANPTVQRTVVDGCTGVPVAIDLTSNPTLDDVVFGAEQDNEFDAIGLLGGLPSDNSVISRRQITMGSGVSVDVSYLLLNSVQVDSLQTLQFDPGVVVKFMPGTWIRVDGRLVTESNASDRVVFTSLHDDQNGFPRDTQRNGNLTAPAAHDWGGITARNGGSLLIQDTDILYAGTGAVQLTGEETHARIIGSKLAYSGSGLSAARLSSAALTACQIQGNTGAGIRYSLEAQVTWSDLLVAGNGIAAIEILPGEVITDQVLAPRIIGDWDNPTYYIADQVVELAQDATLAIQPGVTIKMGSPGAGFLVHGRLVASAPVDNPIIFSSLYDDCTGNPQDTHGNGWTPGPCPGNWGAIEFLRGDQGSVLDGCIVRFGGGTYNGAVIVTGVDVDIRNTLFEYNLTAIGSEGDDLSLIRDKRGPVFANVVFRNNLIDSLVRIGGTLAQDGVLESLGVGKHLFLLDEDLVIPFDTHLDIQPDVNILAMHAGIDVYGSLDWAGERDRVSYITGPSGRCGEYGGGGGGGDLGPGVPQVESCGQVFGCDLETLDPLAGIELKRDEDEESEWEGIRFHASSDDEHTVLRDLVISGAEEPVWIEDSSPLFERVIFDGMAEPGIGILGRSAPRFQECIFRNGLGVPVRTSLSADPQFVDPLFVSNGLHGWGLIGQSSSDAMILDAQVARNSGLNSFIALGDLHVAPGQTLTIGPGVILKFLENAALEVEGQLWVEGVNEFGQVVALTSISDDYWGGDSNCDGAATRARDTTWRGIHCTAATVEAVPVLQCCVVSNVHGTDSPGALHVDGASAVDLDEVLFVENDRHLVFVSGGGDPSLGLVTASDFAGGPEVTAIDNSYPANTVGAEECWWGAASGPRDNSNDVGLGGLFNPGGEGSRVSDGVDYDPFSTEGSHVRLRGDASRDGRVNVFDASVVIRNLAGLWPLDPESLLRADANCDGKVDVMDASVLLSLVAGSLEWLDCQEDLEPLDAGTVHLRFDGFDASSKEISLRWDCERPLRAASMRVRPLQDGLRILDLGLSGQDGQPAICATGGPASEKVFVLAQDQNLPSSPLVKLKLEWDDSVDLSRPLVRIQELWVDGSNEPNVDLRIEGGASPPPAPIRRLSAKPNPFNPTTVIDFVISGDPGSEESVSLGIYDLSGRLVALLVNEALELGSHQRIWNGMDDSGQRTASGVYFLRLVQGSSVVNHKLTLLK